MKKRSASVLGNHPAYGDMPGHHARSKDPHHTFGTFVDALGLYGTRTAMTMRPFLRIDTYTYKDLRVLAYQTAHYLQASNVHAGDRVMVVATNSPQWVVLFLACQLIGVTLVPVDARSNLETVETFFKQTKPVVLFRSNMLLGELKTSEVVLILDDLFTRVAAQPATAPHAKLTGDETAVIVFTSGTTAAPKGVALTQKNILADVYGSKRALTVRRDWRFMSVLPLSHMYELTGGCIVPLASGASIFYLARVTPGAIAKGLKEYKITIMLAVPQLLVLFLDKIRKTAKEEGSLETFEKGLKIASHLPMPARRALFAKVHHELGGALKIIVTGGAPIPFEVDQAWEAMGVVTVQGYGLTETAPVLTMNTLKKRFYESQGHVIDSVSLRIGEGNEIQAKGPSVFSGYFENPKATHEAFTKDGWFKTGDIGRIDNGWLRIQGRAKFAIVRSSGLKVFPEDIELVADREPLFGEVCVVGLRQADGEVVHASIISPASDAAIDKTIAKINGELESFQHIDGWSRWDGDQFPRTRLLKIDRKMVQATVSEAALHARKASADTPPTPADPLAGIITQVLGQPPVSVRDSVKLADLGLDSLRRLAVVSRIEDELGVGIMESKITQQTTVGQLRTLVKNGTVVAKPAPRPEWPYWPMTRVIGNLIRNQLLTRFTNFYVTTKLTGTENLKDLTGPALFIFNHVDGLDGPVIYKSLPRRFRNNLTVALADDLMRQKSWKFTSFMARLCYGAFNFARVEPFTPSLEYVGTLVSRGYNIALAPEGHLGRGGHLEEFKTGIGLLAVELGIPVVPIKTDGLYGIAPLSKMWPQKHGTISVKIGKPVSFNPGDDPVRVSHTLHDIIAGM